MVIDMFKKKKNVAADFHDVLSGDEWDLDCSAHEFSFDFPVCNHTEGIDATCNIGYTQGYMNYIVPFEAELFADEKEVTLGVIMPVLEDVEETSGGRPHQKSVSNHKGNILGMVHQEEHKDNSVLPIGMAIDGTNDDLNITIAYIEFLIAMGVVEFTSNVQNGSIRYFTDIRGNKLVQLLVTLKDDKEVIATTPLKFKSFIAD